MPLYLMRCLLLSLVSLVALAGCSAFDQSEASNLAVDPETVEAYTAMRAEMVKSLDAAIGDALAPSASACRVIPVGVKPCGGPHAYRAYSATGEGAADVDALAAEIAELDRTANERFGLVSTCEVVAEPPVVFEDGACQLGGR